jgi:hypothetical protein
MSAEGSLLSRVASLFAARAGTYCLSALVPMLLGIVSVSAFGLRMYANPGPESTDPLILWRSLTVAEKFIAIFGLLFAWWMPVLLAARSTCRITLSQISGQPVSLGQVLVDMAKFLPATLVYSPTMGLASMIGFSMCVLPGIVVVSLLSLVVPVAVQEAPGVFAALSRGVSLAAKVFGGALMVTIGCCVLMIVVVVLRHLGLDPFLSGPRLFLFRLPIMYLPGLLLLVLANIAFTLLYLEAKGAEERDLMQRNTAAG